MDGIPMETQLSTSSSFLFPVKNMDSWGALYFHKKQ